MVAKVETEPKSLVAKETMMVILVMTIVLVSNSSSGKGLQLGFLTKNVRLCSTSKFSFICQVHPPKDT